MNDDTVAGVCIMVALFGLDVLLARMLQQQPTPANGAAVALMLTAQMIASWWLCTHRTEEAD